jgi:hypothetical protein
MNTKTNDVAMNAFMLRYACIRDKLERLQALADDHFGFVPDDINWGHVGDASSVDDALGEILERFDNH